MFEYFPGNYVWNLALNIALASGAQIGEIDQACRPALEASKLGDDAGTHILTASLERVADRIAMLADEDLKKGRRFSAGAKFRRAAVYLATAERMYPPRGKDRAALYRKMMETFDKFTSAAGEPVERVDIPYQGKRLASLFVKAPSVSGPAPCMVHFDGFDAFKEILYLNGMAEAIEYGPGRHGIGEQSYLYFREPGGVRIEIKRADIATTFPTGSRSTGTSRKAQIPCTGISACLIR